MKTEFLITADTGDMTVTMTVKQDGTEHYRRQFASVTDAALWLVSNIAKVTPK